MRTHALPVERQAHGVTRVAKYAHARHAWARDGKRACLHANGLSLPMGVASARRLAAADQLEAADLAALDADARDALETLVAAGHYQLVKPKRRR